MSKKLEDTIDITSINIGDFASFSIVEIITLQTLLRHREPIKRYALYLEVNQLVHPFIYNSKTSESEKEYEKFLQKSLSTSSFYNSLNTLNKKGLIIFNKSKKDKVDTIEATEETNVALNAIRQFFLKIMVSDYEYLIDMSETILGKIGLKRVNTLLTVWLSELVDVNLITYFTKVADEISILSRSELHKDLIKIGLESINYSRIHNNIIREPNDFFDVVAVPSYRRNPDFFGLSRIDLLKELVRVTKKDGVIVMTGRKELPTTQNFYANELLAEYNKAVSERIFSEEELKQDMNEAGLTRIEVFDYQGLIVTIGKVD